MLTKEIQLCTIASSADDCFKDSIQQNRPKQPTDARLNYVALLTVFKLKRLNNFMILSQSIGTQKAIFPARDKKTKRTNATFYAKMTKNTIHDKIIS